MTIEQDRSDALGGIRGAVQAALAAGADRGVVQGALDDAIAPSAGPREDLQELVAALCVAPDKRAEVAERLERAVAGIADARIRESQMRLGEHFKARAAEVAREAEVQRVVNEAVEAERRRRREGDRRAAAEEEERQRSAPRPNYFAAFTARRD